MIETATTNAIDAAFARARDEGRLAFIPYLTAGYPDRDTALALGRVYARHGADLIEIGIPFSDPFGDGPTIQRASNGALANGMTVAGALALVGELHQAAADTPLVLMGYYNPVFHYGADRFCADAAEAGATGLIVPDLPIEESDDLRTRCRDHGMHLVYLLAPTSTDQRIAAVAERAAGFIYCMAVTGVTGARADLAADLAPFLERVRAHTDLPLVVGFGISRAEHVARLRGLAGGAVVASALVDLVDQTAPDERLAAAADYVERMSRACSAS